MVIEFKTINVATNGIDLITISVNARQLQGRVFKQNDNPFTMIRRIKHTFTNSCTKLEISFTL